MKRVLKNLGWGWLLTGPVLVAFWGWWQVGSIACDLEMQAAASQGLGSKAAYACPLLGYGPLTTATAIGAADLAAVRIAVVAFMIATLFGAIGVVAGYKAFLASPRNGISGGGFTCLIKSQGRGTEIFCEIVGEDSRVAVTGLTVAGDAGATLQTMPDRNLAARETWRWVVLAEHAVRPFKMEVTAVLEDAGGKVSDLSSKWERTADGFKCLSFNRTWR